MVPLNASPQHSVIVFTALRSVCSLLAFLFEEEKEKGSELFRGAAARWERRIGFGKDRHERMENELVLVFALRTISATASVLTYITLLYLVNQGEIFLQSREDSLARWFAFSSSFTEKPVIQTYFHFCSVIKSNSSQHCAFLALGGSSLK